MDKEAKKTLLRVEFVVLLMFAAVTSAVLYSASLTVADRWILNLLHSVRSPFLFALFSYLTILGNVATVVTVIGVSGLLLLWRRHYASAVGLAVSVIGASLSDVGLKLVIGRVRPSGFSDLLPADFSYPSGHATSSFALYGMLTFILCMLYPRYRTFFLTVGSIIIIGVGVSRMYLGVHYPSDVLGGYLLALLWFFAGVKVIRTMHRKPN